MQHNFPFNYAVSDKIKSIHPACLLMAMLFLGQVDQDLECTVTDCSYGYAYIGPRAEVIHTAVDQAGNIATCKYHVLVKG